MRAGRTDQCHRGADLGFFAHPHVRCHLVAAKHPLNQQLQLAAGGLFAKQAGVDDLGVVEHHQIAFFQKLGQLMKNAVGGRGLGAIEQLGAAAQGCRVLGNQRLGQDKIEVA